jgi:hypothetical protein
VEAAPRYRQSDVRPNGGMSVAFIIVSVLGMVVFYRVGAWPVGLLFTGLTAVYFFEFFASVPLGRGAPGSARGATMVYGEKGLGLFHILTGVWLMYLTFATTLNVASGYKLPGG